MKILTKEELTENLSREVMFRVFQNPDTIKKLIADGADAKITREGGTTLLHSIARRDSNAETQRAIIDILLDAGLDINARDKYGSTPLHAMSCSFTDLSVISYFISRGADPSIQNNFGKRAGDHGNEFRQSADRVNALRGVVDFDQQTAA